MPRLSIRKASFSHEAVDKCLVNHVNLSLRISVAGPRPLHLPLHLK